MEPKMESLTNLENQTEKIMYVSTQTNEKIENFKKTIADINDQLKKKKNQNLNQLWTTANKALQLAEENQQKLVSENKKTMKL